MWLPRIPYQLFFNISHTDLKQPPLFIYLNKHCSFRRSKTFHLEVEAFLSSIQSWYDCIHMSFMGSLWVSGKELVSLYSVLLFLTRVTEVGREWGTLVSFVDQNKERFQWVDKLLEGVHGRWAIKTDGLGLPLPSPSVRGLWWVGFLSWCS